MEPTNRGNDDEERQVVECLTTELSRVDAGEQSFGNTTTINQPQAEAGDKALKRGAAPLADTPNVKRSAQEMCQHKYIIANHGYLFVPTKL